jgi:hypothetical protein
MNLSNELVSLFVKSTKDQAKTPKESTVYGTVVQYGDAKYVQLDGSDQLTPCASVADVAVGERVSVQIKNHTATITGNLSFPSAKNSTVQGMGNAIDGNVAYKITANDIEAVNAMIQNLEAILIKCEELNAEEINAVLANIETLKAQYIEGKYITTEELKAITAEIESLYATFGSFSNLSTEHLEAITAEINQLKVYSGDFTYLMAEEFEAINATIKNLDVDNLDAKYANIDFANIGEIAVKKLFAEAGIIKELAVGDAVITGELVGVTIKGDLIEANTLKADKLVVLGSDGIYYKLNIEAGEFLGGEAVPTDSLHGSVITAKSITAEKITVKDLVAFGATIGGFQITSNSLYSGVKESADNTTRGIYLDNDGQAVFGDSKNFFKYHKDTDGTYKLDISASSIKFGASQKNVDDAIRDELNKIKVGARNLIRTSTDLSFENYYFSGAFIAQYNGVGDIAVISGASATTDGNGNVILRGSVKASHDGNGNVTLV